MEAPFAPPRVTAWLAAHARAGIVGGAVGALVFVGMWLLAIARVARWVEDAPVAVAGLAAVVAIAVGLRFGFASPAGGARARALRALGLVPFAIVAGVVTLIAAVLVDEGVTHLSEGAAAGVMACAALAELAIVRAIRRRAPRPRRDEDRRVGPLLWSGLLASSIGLAAFGGIDALSRKDAIGLSSSSRVLLAVALVTFGLVLAVARGQGAETRARIALGRRFGGTFFFALLTAPAVVLVAAGVAAALDARSSETGAVVLGVGLVAALVAIARGRGLVGAPRRDLVESGVIASALLLGAGYVTSTWFRYALGSASAADALAHEHLDKGELERAATYFRIACERGVDTACAVASDMIERGSGVAPDARLAAKLRRLACDDASACMDLVDQEPLARDVLRRRACELGDRVACVRSELAALKSACDARDVFACRDLATRADREQPGSGFAAWESACALGDAAACARVPR